MKSSIHLSALHSVIDIWSQVCHVTKPTGKYKGITIKNNCHSVGLLMTQQYNTAINLSMFPFMEAEMSMATISLQII